MAILGIPFYFSLLAFAPFCQPLQVTDNVADQTPNPALSIHPSIIIGKVDHHLNFTVSLSDFRESKSSIKIFWETTGPYISPEGEARNIILNSDNDFNASVSIVSSLIGVYSIKFFQIGEGKDKIYFNNGSEISVIVKRESENIKTYFTITFSVLISIALLFMGMDIDMDIVKKTLKRPIGPAVGVVCQFLLMPVIAYGLGYLLLDSNYERLGFLFVGCSPGGSNSNLWTSMFGGDIDLSVTMTFVSTLFSFAMTTFWIHFLGTPLVDNHVQIPYGQLALTLVSLLIPCLLGIFFKQKLPKKAEIVKKYVSKPFFLLVLVIVPIFGCYINSFFFYLCSWNHVVCGMLLGVLGYIFGAGMAAIFCQELPQIIAISLETAMQNAGVAYVALNLTVESPYSDMAVIPMLAFILLTTGPMVFVFYGVYFIFKKLTGGREGWKEVHKEEPSDDKKDGVDC